MFKCEECGRDFGYKHHLKRHLKNVHKIAEPDLSKYKISRYFCKYCGEETENSYKLASHTSNCSSNPNYEKIRLQRAEYAKKKTGTKRPIEINEKARQTINAKIKAGTWHTSFARRRTFEYKGIKFQGSWEVEFAKYLDTNNIKWRRPNESFVYNFKGKERRYHPDFFLEDEKCYYEIKGCAVEKDIAKWTQFPLKLKVLTGEDLEQIGINVVYRKQKLEFDKQYN